MKNSGEQRGVSPPWTKTATTRRADGQPLAGLWFVASLLLLTAGCSKSNDQQLADQVQMVRDGKSNVVDIRDKPISGDQALQPLQNIVGVRKLNLDNSPVTDAALQGLGPMPELRDLSLTRTLITDDALPMIVKQFPGLEALRLDRTAITDKNLSELSKLTSLQQLSLFRTRISDSGCLQLAKIATLKKLSLDQTQITDVGFKTVATMPRLESLSVWKTQVTDEAAAAFSEEHVNVKLNR